jgi:hypothetical protein
MYFGLVKSIKFSSKFDEFEFGNWKAGSVDCVLRITRMCAYTFRRYYKYMLNHYTIVKATPDRYFSFNSDVRYSDIFKNHHATKEVKISPTELIQDVRRYWSKDSGSECYGSFVVSPVCDFYPTLTELIFFVFKMETS